MPALYAPEVRDGEFIGDYQVVGVLGRGPTGTTYHALHGPTGKEFALKSVFLSKGISLEWLERLEAQSVLSSKLRSLHVDPIVTTGRSGPFWYAIKDFVHDGEGSSCDLRQFMARHGGRLTSHLTARILKQLIHALHAAQQFTDHHHQGVLHGNLKPENILIGHASMGDIEVKITDWQPYALEKPDVICEIFDQWQKLLGEAATPISHRATAQALRGIYQQYDYIAPELRLRQRPTIQGDVFSVGCLVHEMLTGELPVGPWRRVSERFPELPEEWDGFLESCLPHRVDLRFQDYDSIAKYLLENFSEEKVEIEEKKVVAPEKQERLSLTPKGMVFLPAAQFFVGGVDCGDDCLPEHEVETAGFYIDRTPVTNAQFKEFVDATGYETEAERGEGGPVWLEGEWTAIPGVSWMTPFGRDPGTDFSQHPVIQVSYADACAYAEWRGNRLPTEAEWEYAARGGLRGMRYPWGNTISRNQANFSSDSTTPVMQSAANGFGLYDVAGNVWEWTSSWYQAYPGNQMANPNFGEKYRVVRGGAWMYDGAHCMVAYRNANQPQHCYPTLGFRTVRDYR